LSAKSTTASDELVSLERELERIFASLGQGMYVVDRERRIVLWNRAAESILEWPEEATLGKDCREFIGHLDDEGEQVCDKACPLLDTIEKPNTIYAGTVWAHTKSGELVPVNVSCAPLFENGQVVGAVEVFSDMTHEKEVDRIKSTICSVAAHELRTPLTSMKGYLELALGGEVGELNEELQEFLGIVSENAQRMQELIDEFLDVEKLESGRNELHWEELEIHSLAEQAVTELAPTARAKSLLVHSELGEVPAVQGDRHRVKQVLSNVLSNAIKYTNKGKVGVRTYADESNVIIEVWDTGVGIPEDEVGKLGEKFFRASTAAETTGHGSGLGLLITKEIIKKHDGELIIESKRGKGSRFSILLPIAKERRILRGLKEGSDE
jgi:PAS domain S-box-containing protein